MDGQQNSAFVDEFDNINDAPQVDGDAPDSSFANDYEISEEFSNELDELGGDISTVKTDDDDDSLPPAAAAQNLHGDNSQGKQPETDEKTDDKDDKSSDEGKDADAKADDADLTEEDKKYINSLPKPERAQAREWHKKSRMQTTFLDPKVSADQWVNNLRAKSEMRFGEVERSIFKTSAADPVKLLTGIYDATADGEGNSEAYGKLLESMFDTNREFFSEILAGKSLKIISSDAADQTDSTLIDPAKLDSMTSETLAEIEDSFSFQNFKDSEPELAEKVLQSLKANELLKQELAGKTPKDETPEEKAAREQREETERQSAEQKRTAEATEARARVETFENAYTENVTDFYTDKLNRDYGLQVTDKEREEFPLMAFLKESKLAAIRYGIGNMSDFDDGLKEFGKDRPAFTEALENAITYAKAKESANTSSALRGTREITDEYLKERLNAPEIKLIDDLMQIVAAQQNKGLSGRRETVPTTLSTKPAEEKGKGLIEDIDDLG